MSNLTQPRSRILGILWRVAGAAMVSAIATAIVATSSAQAQTFTSLYSFMGETDGANPSAPVVRDAKGNLYGTTVNGGNPGGYEGFGCGTVFKVDATGKETVLYRFTGGADGANPIGGLLRVNGNLYGTTAFGGDYNGGTVFKIDRTDKETVVHSFTGLTDGGSPNAGLARDKQGNLYGTTSAGGDFVCSAGCGTVFKVDTNGNESLLYTFTGPGGDGRYPNSRLVLDKQGNLYGNTGFGGAFDSGTVFKIDTNGRESVLYSFAGTGGDGIDPYGNLVRDVKGNLYGTTTFGGAFGYGTVYRLDITGKEIVLYSFMNLADGAVPRAGLVRAHGKIYGTTNRGGDLGCDCGIIFMLNETGQETVLHTFTLTDGGFPAAELLRDKMGNLYGTTAGGYPLNECQGDNNCGTVFKLTP